MDYSLVGETIITVLVSLYNLWGSIPSRMRAKVARYSTLSLLKIFLPALLSLSSLVYNQLPAPDRMFP